VRKLLIAALGCLCAIGLAAIGGGTAHAAVSGCTGTFQVTSVTFDRTSVRPGQFLTAAATIQNCTDQTQTPSGYWLARAIVPAGSPPTLCAGNDPYPLTSAPIAPGGTFTTSFTFDVLSQCTASAIRVSIRIYGSPDVTQSADIPVDGAPAGCAVSYHNDSEWSTGFVAQVTISNRGTTSIGGWSLSFNFTGDQRVSNSWGATVQQSGTAVAAVNAPWTATIAPGGSVSFGMYGSWQRSDLPPVSFALNGQVCQTV
jgi:cellulase/cellobiase CelA1